MKSEPIRFPGSQGYRLEGRLDLPDDGQPAAYAIFAHCFGCTKNLKSIANLGRALTDAGIGVLRFDFTGLGESDGEFADTNFTSNVLDLVAAARFLAANYAAPRLLIGHSLGGAAVLQAAAALPTVAGVVTIAAPSDLRHVRAFFAARIPDAGEGEVAQVTLMGRTFRITRQFLENLSENQLAHTIGSLGRPLLILHAPADDTVPVAHAERIFALAQHPKSLVALDRGDHLLLDEADARYAGEIIAAWFSRYRGPAGA